MQYIEYKDFHYHVAAVRRDNNRWDAIYEIHQQTDDGLKRLRAYQVQTAYGFDDCGTALADAERNARADIEQGIVLYH